MKKYIISVLALMIFNYAAVAQNIGIGTTSPSAKLTINGNLALLSDTIRVSCEILPSRMLINNSAKARSVLHLINDGCITFFAPNIVGLNGGTDGKMVTLITHLNNTVIQHLQWINGSPAAQDSANMIELYEPNSNGVINQPASISLNAGGSVTMIYDGIRNRWKVLSYSGDLKTESLGWFRGLNANDIYNPNGGNVGIGTGTPAQKLDVAGNMKVRNDLLVDGNIGAGTTTPGYKLTVKAYQIGISQESPDGQTKIGFYTEDGNIAYVQTHTNTDLNFSTNNGAPQMRLKTSGNFGIGVTSPNATLSVARKTGTDGTAAFFGTAHNSHFNYGTNEDTYIRAGKDGAGVILNDFASGTVNVGSATGFAGAKLSVTGSFQGAASAAVSAQQNVANTYLNVGVEGFANGSSATNDGVRGIVGGSAMFNTGGSFVANNTASLLGAENDGIFASAHNATSNYAGSFDGNVYIGGLLQKLGGSFKIDHPLDPANKYLYHSFVESPDMMNIYNGNIITGNDGIAVVQLPGYFRALNKDFRYQLTVLGQFAQAIIFEKINNNQFKIKTDKPNVEVSWQVTGIRQDAWANANRIVPEVEKEANNKSMYLTPEVFGQPEEKGIINRKLQKLLQR